MLCCLVFGKLRFPLASGRRDGESSGAGRHKRHGHGGHAGHGGHDGHAGDAGDGGDAGHGGHSGHAVEQSEKYRCHARKEKRLRVAEIRESFTFLRHRAHLLVKLTFLPEGCRFYFLLANFCLKVKVCKIKF